MSLYVQDAGKSSGISMVPLKAYLRTPAPNFILKDASIDLAAQVCAKFVLQK